MLLSLYGEEDISTLAFIFDDFEGFIQKASQYAAEELLELGNQWQYDDCEEGTEFVPMTEEDFVKRICLNHIAIEDVEGGGGYSLWFNDGDIFWGHSIAVNGNIKTGFSDAGMHG
ncbi:MAG: DUF2262 domain-containing protein [Defluviitaleaceae bacterium]|nr:DUF2262 domain-containing protein [Defluviitaleaceae bacterium]